MAKKKGVSGKTHTKKQLDDYANQNNPNNKAYKANKENRSVQKTSGTILVFLKAKATVGVTTDHQSVSAEKRNVLLRHGNPVALSFRINTKGREAQ